MRNRSDLLELFNVSQENLDNAAAELISNITQILDNENESLDQSVMTFSSDSFFETFRKNMSYARE